MDVYYGSVNAEKNLLHFGSYLVMFPKLLQGPITRYKDIKNELTNPQFITDNLMTGARRFIIGLAKKVFLADMLAIVANKVFQGDNLSLIGADVAWYGLLAYTLQIFFDFSGYTDMAIGLGKMLGFSLPENFNFPYISRSITEFWRRWHMSLTAWFRTYVFIPLEFSRKRVKFFRQQSNIIIVFLLTGLWHGTGWNFLVWGVYFGLILALETGKLGKFLKKIPVVFQHLYTIILIMLGWIIFRLPDVSQWGTFIKALLGENGWTGLENMRSLDIVMYFPILILAAVLSVPWFTRQMKKINLETGWLRAVTDICCIVIFLIAATFILSNGFRSFLYAQF
jgi:alginate O-acetyltransferase complex protein AlgI